jgi:HSP90 family molecular chaperone
VLEAIKEELIEVIKLQGSINSPWLIFIHSLKKYLFCRCKNNVDLRDRNLEDEKKALKEEIDAIIALYDDFSDLMQ